MVPPRAETREKLRRVLAAGGLLPAAVRA
jgi:hypothetical protein